MFGGRKGHEKHSHPHDDDLGSFPCPIVVPFETIKKMLSSHEELKKYNKNIKVLVYRNSNLVIEGGLHSDLEFLAHPEWTLKNSSGSPIYNNGNTQPFINFTNPAAREWWVSSIVSAITQQPNGTAIDGVYSDDPVKNPDATLYDQLSYQEVLEKELKVMDLSAFTLARDHSLPIRVFNMNEAGCLKRVVMGEQVGTLICHADNS